MRGPPSWRLPSQLLGCSSELAGSRLSYCWNQNNDVVARRNQRHNDQGQIGEILLILAIMSDVTKTSSYVVLGSDPKSENLDNDVLGLDCTSRKDEIFHFSGPTPIMMRPGPTPIMMRQRPHLGRFRVTPLLRVGCQSPRTGAWSSFAFVSSLFFVQRRKIRWLEALSELFSCEGRSIDTVSCAALRMGKRALKLRPQELPTKSFLGSGQLS